MDWFVYILVKMPHCWKSHDTAQLLFDQDLRALVQVLVIYVLV